MYVNRTYYPRPPCQQFLHHSMVLEAVNAAEDLYPLFIKAIEDYLDLSE
jgi:hypothetical protein